MVIIKKRSLFYFLTLIVCLSASAVYSEAADQGLATTDSTAPDYKRTDYFRGKFLTDGQASLLNTPFECPFEINPVVDLRDIKINFFIPKGIRYLRKPTQNYVGKIFKDQTIQFKPEIMVVEHGTWEVRAYVEATLPDGRKESWSYYLFLNSEDNSIKKSTTPPLAYIHPSVTQALNQIPHPEKKTPSPVHALASNVSLNALISITVTGRWLYENEAGLLKPARYVRVRLYKYTDPQGFYDGGWTDSNGYFSISHSIAEGGSEDLAVVLQAEVDFPGHFFLDPIDVTGKNGSTSDIYRVFSARRTVSSSDSNSWDFGTAQIDSSNSTIWGALDDIVDEQQWIAQQESVPWTSFPVIVRYPLEDWPHSHGSEIHLPYKATSYWDRRTVLHEYGHCVMWKWYNNSFPPGGGPSPHYIFSESSPGFAFVEGWAEFIECAVDNDPARMADYFNGHGGNLETNDLYNCIDTGDFDGDIIEGSVASILWDIFDAPSGTPDDDPYQLIPPSFKTIWAVIYTSHPNDINEFWSAWLSFFGGLDIQQLFTVYYNYGINKDTVPPYNGTMLINNGAERTTSLIVTLDNLGAADDISGLSKMRFSNDGVTWSAEENYASSKSNWDMSMYGGSKELGTKTVYVRYGDKAGNWSASFSDSIIYATPLEAPPRYVLKWGSQGSGDGQFNSPVGICSDPSGNIYVADSNNNRIQKFTSSGVSLGWWGGCNDPGYAGSGHWHNPGSGHLPQSGTGDGEFNSPVGVCSDTSGNIYVADAGNYRIQKFTPNGIFVTKWGAHGPGDGQFAEVDGICSDRRDNIYVTDGGGLPSNGGNNRVQKFTSDGAFVTKWGTYGSGDGQFGGPGGICSDPQDNIYVIDWWNNRIEKFTQDGVFIVNWGNGPFAVPAGICSDPHGNIYVTNFNSRCIQAYAQEGTLITSWGTVGTDDGQFSSLSGICSDLQGYVYVVDVGNNRIQKFRIAVGSPPILTADLDANGQKDVAIDFGSTYGIWIYYNNSTWQQLHGVSAVSMTAGNLDSDPNKDLIVDFGPQYGIWAYYNNSTWTQLHGVSAESITTADLDNNGQDEVIVDFGSTYGIWIYYNNSTWQQLHGISAESITSGNLDSDPKKDLVVDFGPTYGIWIYYNNSTWQQLHGVSAESITTADLDNNGQDEVIVDFGSTYGIWIYYNNSTWQQLHGISAVSMTAGNLDSDPKKDLVVDFGSTYGIWIYYNNSTWIQLHGVSANFITTGDMNGNGQDEIIVDLGPQYGVWVYYDNNTWAQLHTVSP